MTQRYLTIVRVLRWLYFMLYEENWLHLCEVLIFILISKKKLRSYDKTEMSNSFYFRKNSDYNCDITGLFSRVLTVVINFKNYVRNLMLWGTPFYSLYTSHLWDVEKKGHLLTSHGGSELHSGVTATSPKSTPAPSHPHQDSFPSI